MDITLYLHIWTSLYISIYGHHFISPYTDITLYPHIRTSLYISIYGHHFISPYMDITLYLHIRTSLYISIYGHHFISPCTHITLYLHIWTSLYISIYGHHFISPYMDITSLTITLNEFSASYNSILLKVLFKVLPTADITQCQWQTNADGASVEWDGKDTSAARWQKQVTIPVCPTQIPHWMQ